MAPDHPAVRWLLRRAAQALLVVAGVTTLTFILIHLAPGDPIYALAGDGGNAQYYADMRARYGLDRPLAVQFVAYARLVFSGDLGYSFMFQAPVAAVLMDHLAPSMLLAAAALILAAVAGIVLGGLAALSRDSWIDVLIRLAAPAVYAAPVFWTGQMLMLLFALRLGLLPVAGFQSARDPSSTAVAVDVARHLVLPAVTLALPFVAVVMSVTRASLLTALGEPFITAAAARGASRLSQVFRHAGGHAAVPIAALVGQHAAGLVAGAALTEALFGWPGLGYLVLHASLHRDYPLVTGAFIVIAAGVAAVAVATDAVCAWLDPRVRLA